MGGLCAGSVGTFFSLANSGTPLGLSALLCSHEILSEQKAHQHIVTLAAKTDCEPSWVSVPGDVLATRLPNLVCPLLHRAHSSQDCSPGSAERNLLQALAERLHSLLAPSGPQQLRAC